MPQEMTGRRIPYDPSRPNRYLLLTQAGDYYGPDKGELTGGVPAVHYLLPIARDVDAPPAARSHRHLTEGRWELQKSKP